jgi:hypothetical protein
MIRNEIRIPLSVCFFLCIFVPFLIADKLGILSAIFFSVASLIIFCILAIMPEQLKEKYAKLKIRHSPIRIYYRQYQDDKDKVDSEYHSSRNYWFGVSVIFLVSGIIAYLIVHS